MQEKKSCFVKFEALLKFQEYLISSFSVEEMQSMHNAYPGHILSQPPDELSSLCVAHKDDRPGLHLLTRHALPPVHFALLTSWLSTF